MEFFYQGVKEYAFNCKKMFDGRCAVGQRAGCGRRPT